MLAFMMVTSCCKPLVLPVMAVTWFRKRKCLKWQWPQHTPSLPSFLSFLRKGACEAAAEWAEWGDISTPSVEEMNEEEALGSSYTANNVTGWTVWTMGLWGLSSGEIILTGLIQQEDDRSIDQEESGKVTSTVAGWMWVFGCASINIVKCDHLTVGLHVEKWSFNSWFSNFTQISFFCMRHEHEFVVPGFEIKS